MRFMMIVKADEQTEAGVLPTEKVLADMAKFNEKMLKAGVMLSGDGLKASVRGARVSFEGGKPTVTDGPFTETKELIAGYWIIQVKSKKDAIAWAKQVPFEKGQVEIREFFELEDFDHGKAIDHHRKLAKKIAKKK